MIKDYGFFNGEVVAVDITNGKWTNVFLGKHPEITNPHYLENMVGMTIEEARKYINA